MHSIENPTEVQKIIDNYYGQEYTPGLIEQSKYKQGESSSEYVARLKKLYPKEEQLTYINALAAITRIFIYALSITESYISGKKPNPKVAEVFPEKLNLNNTDMKSDEIGEQLLTIRNEDANDIIVTLNNSAHTLNKVDKQKVEEMKKIIKLDFIGETKSDNLLLSEKLRLRRNKLRNQLRIMFVGAEVANNAIDEMLAEKVTSKSLELKAGIAAKRMKKITTYINKEFNFFNLGADLEIVGRAFTDVNIAINLNSDLQDAFQNEVDVF